MTPTRFDRGVPQMAMVLAATVAILFLRRPDAFLNPQFWAEDFLFLMEAEQGGWSALFTPRVGYLHLLPRTIAGTAAHFDPFLQPIFFSAGAVAVLLVVILSCLSNRHDLPGKPLLALAVVLVPHSGEVFFNPTNAQWIAALALLLTLIKRDASTTFQWISDLGVLVFAGLSGPFVLFTAPFYALRAWQRRSPASGVLFIVIVAAASTQAWFIWQGPPDREFVGDFSALSLWANVSYRLPYTLFLGVAARPEFGRGAAIAAGSLIVLFIGVAATRDGPHRRELLVFLGFTALLLASTTLRKRFDLWHFPDLANGDRYFFIPKVLLLWVVVTLAATVAADRWIRWTAAGLLAAGFMLNAPRYRFQPYQDHAWYSLCPDIRAGKSVTVTINPDWTFSYQRRDVIEGR